jgi:hypothetical protein
MEQPVNHNSNSIAAEKIETKPKVVKVFTQQLVIEGIQEYQRQGRLSQIWKIDPILFRAGCKRFGNWQNARKAAGFEPRVIRRWSKEIILNKLCLWQHESVSKIRTLDPQLAYAAKQYFGNVTSAWKAAGLEPKGCYWTNQRVIATIQDRYVKGLSIDRIGFGERPLAAAAKRRFGSWRQAVAAAGLEKKLAPPKTVRRWNKATVVQAVWIRHRLGLCLAKTHQDDAGFYTAAKKHFGTWSKALIAAGIQPTPKRWTKDRVIAEIRSWHSQHVKINKISCQDARLYAAAVRLFGNWYNALISAGLKLNPCQKKRWTRISRSVRIQKVISSRVTKSA